MSLPPPGSPTPFGDPSPHRTPTAPPGYGPGAGQPPAPPPPGYQAYSGGYAPYGYTPANPATQFGPIAGFGIRLGAFVLDWLLYGMLLLALAMAGIFVTIGAFDDCSNVDGDIRCTGGELDGGGFALGLALIFAAMVVVGFVYLWSLARTGRTLGRKLVGIKVINQRTGEAPGWGKAIGRTAFAALVSGQIFYVGYLWMLWDDNKQTLHDKVSGTHVIEAR